MMKIENKKLYRAPFVKVAEIRVIRVLCQSGSEEIHGGITEDPIEDPEI